jgi:SSS family solute:Na+ symporter
MLSFGSLMITFSLVLMGSITWLGYLFSKRKMQDSDSYFTAGRDISTAFMTATFIAYAVGTGLIFSPGEMAYLEGLTAMIGYGLAISLSYIVFLPVSGRIKELIPEGNTIGEYARVRYGKIMYIVVLFVSIVYMFCLLAANLIGAGIAFNYIGHVPLYIGVLVIGVPVIIYTSYGGLGAAIFTNGLQAILITPMLFITAHLAFRNSGGTVAIYNGIQEHAPDFLKVFHPTGLEFALMIIIAVSAAELLNQALWQRVYSAKDIRVVKKGLVSASLMTFPMTIVAASFGLMAVAYNIELPHPSIATALMADNLLPPWASMIFMMIIVLAATSTASDALAGFSSIASLDIIKSFMPNLAPEKAVLVGRISTVVFGVGAMLVAFKAPSILFLLLTADLVAAAAVIPVVAGLFSPNISGNAAALGTILGILIGLPLFLNNQHLLSFVTAIIVSSAVIFVYAKISPARFDFNKLKEHIRAVD